MAFMIAKIPSSRMGNSVLDDNSFLPEDELYEFVIFYLSVLAFGINTVSMIVIEVREFKAKKIKKYFTFENFVQLFTIAVNLALIFQVLACTGTFINLTSNDDFYDRLDNLRINMVICIILNIIELFQRVSIFDFFALFVRQL